MSADEAFAHLGIDRTTGYRAIRDGRFPLPVIRVGRVIRVPTNELRKLLGIDDPAVPKGNRYSDGGYADAPQLELAVAHDGGSPRPDGAPRRAPDAGRSDRHQTFKHPGTG